MASRTLRVAREKGMPVIHVQVGFRPGLPEVSARNELFAAIIASLQRQEFFQGASGASTRPRARTQRHRRNQTSGERLQRHGLGDDFSREGIRNARAVRYRDQRRCTLDLVGRRGRQLSYRRSRYRIVVVADCCVDQDAELHDALVNPAARGRHHRR